MTPTERRIFRKLIDAYRIIRGAYHHDMHHEAPSMNDLQAEAERILALSDDEVIAEATAEGLNVADEAARGRAILQKAIERNLKPGGRQ
jgi:hypothetical protein